MSGLRPVVELEAGAGALDPGVVYAREGRLWEAEAGGCAACLHGAEGPGDRLPCWRTLSDVETDDAVCLDHGPLEPVRVTLRRQVCVNVGGLVREQARVEEYVALVPRALGAAERLELLEQVLSEFEEMEKQEA